MPREIHESCQKKLLRLMSASCDLTLAALSYRRFLQAADSDEKYFAVQSMAVCYARPFTENNGLGSLYNEYPDLSGLDLVDAQKRHGVLMDMRHGFHSHSSKFGVKLFLLAPGSINPADGVPVSDYTWQPQKRTFENADYIAGLYPLIEALLADVNQSIAEIIKKIGPICLESGEVRELETGADDFQWSPPEHHSRPR